MPGYLINLGAPAGRLKLYIESGIYGTKIGRTGWYPATLYTLADYLTMQPGDLVFFFQKRMIYGIGSIATLANEGAPGPVFCNFQRSHVPTLIPSPPYVWNGDEDPDIRWRVIFRPSPAFFQNGVDMDEVLQADTAGVARSLRVFWNRSFVKMEDDETNLIATAILRRNQSPDSPKFEDHSESVHDELARNQNLPDFLPNTDDLVSENLHGNEIRHEPTLQAWLADALTRGRPNATAIFGEWSHIANLYPASPLKPRDYMDEIDLFGYTLARAQQGIAPFPTKFKVIEVKKGSQTAGPANVIDQVMKYVDWISTTRAGGDYALVDGYVVAAGFNDEAVEYARRARARTYVMPRRPYQTKTWDNLSLVTYSASQATPAVELRELLSPS